MSEQLEKTVDALHSRVDQHSESLIRLSVQHEMLGNQLSNIDSFMREHMGKEEGRLREVQNAVMDLKLEVSKYKNWVIGAVMLGAAMWPLVLFLSKQGIL